MNGGSLVARSLTMTDILEFEEDRLLHPLLPHSSNFQTCGQYTHLSNGNQLALHFGRGSPVQLSGPEAPALDRHRLSEHGHTGPSGVVLKHEVCDDEQGGISGDESPAHDDKQNVRPRKPHLQGRFSGRLATKEDEKRLVDECRLLGPLLGGVGKRGDRSRLTLAKIVRGIAAGEVRRHCEERESRLKVLKNKLSVWEQTGRQQLEGLQQENRGLRSELDSTIRRMREMEKELSLRAATLLDTRPVKLDTLLVDQSVGHGGDSMPSVTNTIQGQVSGIHQLQHSEDSSMHLHPLQAGDNSGAAGLELQQSASQQVDPLSLLIPLSPANSLLAVPPLAQAPQVVQVVHAAQVQVVQANQAVQASLHKAQVHAVKHAEAVAQAQNLHIKAQVMAQAQADIEAQVINLKQHVKQLQQQVVVSSEVEAHNLQIQAQAHAQAAMEANYAAKRYDAAAQAHAQAQAAAQAQAQELHMKAQSLQAQVEQLQHSAAAAAIPPPAAQPVQLVQVNSGSHAPAQSHPPSAPFQMAMAPVTTGIPPSQGGLGRSGSMDEHTRAQMEERSMPMDQDFGARSMPMFMQQSGGGGGGMHNSPDIFGQSSVMSGGGRTMTPGGGGGGGGDGGALEVAPAASMPSLHGEGPATMETPPGSMNEPGLGWRVMEAQGFQNLISGQQQHQAAHGYGSLESMAEAQGMQQMVGEKRAQRSRSPDDPTGADFKRMMQVPTSEQMKSLTAQMMHEQQMRDTRNESMAQELSAHDAVASSRPYPAGGFHTPPPEQLLDDPPQREQRSSPGGKPRRTTNDGMLHGGGAAGQPQSLIASMMEADMLAAMQKQQLGGAALAQPQQSLAAALLEADMLVAATRRHGGSGDHTPTMEMHHLDMQELANMQQQQQQHRQG